MKIVVVGLGYVGLSNAILLAQANEVIGVDISAPKIKALEQGQSPIIDNDISFYLKNKDLNFKATKDLEGSLPGADYVIVATPTNFDAKTMKFNTTSVEQVIEAVHTRHPATDVVIRSTIPVGYVDQLNKRLGDNVVMFSPEFLREGKALHDNLYPSRIIVGENSTRAKKFAGLLASAAIKKDVEILLTGAPEAEAIKLFSNSYLAMRVAFFNELDSYALVEGLNAKHLIEGVCLDPRISQHYNNPSFGYGGYCLPKDTKQLLTSYADTPQNLISAIISSNETRKAFLAQQIISLSPKIVGVHRLAMKHGSDNFRESSIKDLIDIIKSENIQILLYEPLINDQTYEGISVMNHLPTFKSSVDMIITKRLSSELHDVQAKVFTRDIFQSN